MSSAKKEGFSLNILYYPHSVYNSAPTHTHWTEIHLKTQNLLIIY